MRSRAALLSCLLLPSVATVAAGQAIVHPNQIVGDLRITSVNPEIVAVLDEPIATGHSWYPSGTSTTAPFLEASTSARSPTARAAAYELTVEAGLTGIAYTVRVTRSGNRSQYVFEKKGSAPVLREPAPDVRVDFAECAGLLRIRMPSGVTSASAEAQLPNEWGNLGMQARVSASTPAGSELLLVARGEATPHRVIVRYTVGTNPFLDTLTLERSFDVVLHCDEILDLDCSGGGGSGFALGAVTGRIDVLGEDEARLDPTTTIVSARNGPWGNERHDWIDRVPSSGDFLLPNMVSSEEVEPPRPYFVAPTLRIRSGRRHQIMDLPPAWVSVPRGSTVDIGDTFVIDPGYVGGDVRLAGPPARAPLGSPWDHLQRPSDDDSDGDGLPATSARGGGSTQALASVNPWLTGSNGAGLAAAEIDGGRDAATDWRGDYELVLGGLDRSPQTWNVGILCVALRAGEQPGVPGSFLSSTALIEERAHRDKLISPGDRHEVPLRYCFSRLDVRFLATAGTFFGPKLQDSSAGSYSGPDFEGQRGVSYEVELVADGTPSSRAEAAAAGTVTAFVPQGTYTMRPRVVTVNPGGGTSLTELLPFSVSVGCREEIVVHPELGVDLSVSPLPACAGDAPVRLSGRVRGAERIESVAWSVKGGASGFACTDCGVNPAFDVQVPLLPGDNEVVVTATDAAGRAASVTGHSRASREPSAIDLRPGSTPLTVRRAPDAMLDLAWEDRPGEEASAYQGSIDALVADRGYDHGGIGACDLGASVRIAMPEGDAYFLIGDACDWGDGSLGRDASGRERPAAVDRCR